MKKFFIFLSIFASLCLFSCSFAEDESEYLSAPSVAIDKPVISHARRSSSDTEVYVYRINNTSTDQDHNSYHIGTLYPQNITDEILQFSDTLAYTNKKYKYQFVFIDSDGNKHPTEWSSEATIAGGLNLSDTPNIKYDIPSTIYLAYDSRTAEKTLQVGGGNIQKLGLDNSGNPNIDNFAYESKYVPTLILKTNLRSVAFDLKNEQLNNIDYEQGTTRASIEKIVVTSFLPSDFYNKKIECVGIAGKYVTTNTNGDKILYIYWTEPAAIKTVYAEDTSVLLSNFEIKSTEATGTNY